MIQNNYYRVIDSNHDDDYQLQCLDNYLNGINNSNLLKLYCNAKMILPSVLVIQKLQKRFTIFIRQDNELDKMFNNLSLCTRLFYTQLMQINKQYIDNIHEFRADFESYVQPIGQQFIDTLFSIFNRIRLIESNTSYVKYLIHNLRYKFSKYQLTHHKFIQRLYYLLTIITIMFSCLMNVVLFNNIQQLFSIMLTNTFIGIAVVITSMIAYPINDFNDIDVSGNNLVAYKYKLLLNHTLIN